MKKDDKTNSFSLRQKAEDQLKKKRSATDAPGARKLRQPLIPSEADTLKLIHELEVHQIELEMQNDELMLARSAAQEAAEKYSTLYDFAPMGYFTLTGAGEIIGLNLSGAQLLGKERSRLINRHFGIFVSTETKPIFNLFLWKVFNSKVKETCELALSNNGNLPVHVYLTGIAGQNREHCLVTAIDISGRKQAEELLLESRKMLFEAQKLAHIGVWNWEAATDRVTWTEELYHIAGLDPLLPAPCFAVHSTLYTPSSWHLLNAAVENAMKTGEPYQLELELLRPDGSIRDVKAFGGAKVDRNGKITGLFGTLQDITERRQAERIFQEIIEKNPLSIQIVDMDGYTLQANPAHTSLFGSVPPPGFSIFDDLITKYPALEKMIQLAKSGEVVHLPDIHYNVKDSLPGFPGSPVWIRAVIFPLKDSSGIPERFVIMHENITGSKLAEQELQKDEERFRHISSTISDISYSCLTGKDGNYSLDWLTGSVDHITGYSVDELMAKQCWAKLVVDEDMARFKQHVSNLSPGSNSTCELRLLHKSGKIIWVASYAECVASRVSPGHTILYGAIVDITGRRQAEEEIRKSNLFLNTIIENIPDMVFLKDAKELRFVRFNQAGEKILGIPQEELLGKNDYDFFLKEQADFFTADDREVLHSKVMKDIAEESLLTAHQGTRIMHTKKVPILNELGEPEYLLGISEDITDRRQALEEIKKISRYFQSILEKAPDGLVLLDAGGNFKMINPSARRIFGFGVTEQITGNPAQYTHPDDLQMVLAHLARLLEDPSYVPVLQYRYADKNGNWKWVESIFTNLLADPDVESIVINFRDITERKLAEEELQKKQHFIEGILNATPNLIYIYDIVKQCNVYANYEVEEFLGYSPEQVMAYGSALFETILHPDDAALVAKHHQHCLNLKPGEFFEVEYRMKHASGQWRWLKSRDVLLVSSIQENCFQILGSAEDITESKLAEQQIKKLNRVYAVLSNVNEAIARVQNEDELFESICRIAVEDGKFLISWIGKINHAANQVDVMYSCGDQGDYIEKLNIQMSDEAFGNGPAGKTIKTGNLAVSMDIANDESMAPWRERALRRGLRSSIALPVKIFGNIYGTLNLYAGEVNFFDRDEIELLDKLAENISFALEFLQSESERRQSETKLHEVLLDLKKGQEMAHVGNWKWDIVSNTYTASEECLRMFGYPPDSTPTLKEVSGYFLPGDRKRASELLNRSLQTGEPYAIELKITRKDTNEIRNIVSKGEILLGQDGKPIAVFGTNLDNTERKKAEDELKKQMDELQRFQRLTVGRELTMIGLKKEVNELLKKLGQEEKYRIVE